MVAIRAIYDGESFKPLPTESLPKVEGEVPVAIVFLNGVTTAPVAEETQWEIAARMRARRDAMPPLDLSIPEMIEEGRER